MRGESFEGGQADPRERAEQDLRLDAKLVVAEQSERMRRGGAGPDERLLNALKDFEVSGCEFLDRVADLSRNSLLDGASASTNSTVSARIWKCALASSAAASATSRRPASGKISAANPWATSRASSSGLRNSSSHTW